MTGRALRTLRAGVTLRALNALDPLLALRTGRTIFAVYPVDAGVTLRALRSRGALHTLDPLGALRAGGAIDAGIALRSLCTGRALRSRGTLGALRSGFTGGASRPLWSARIPRGAVRTGRTLTPAIVGSLDCQ